VLAHEQVIDGRCERCGTVVEQRELEQWFLRITAYADRLLGNLDTLDWSDNVKQAQRAWIGRSEGARFALDVDDSNGVRIEVFTTRPDTIAGMTYVVLAPEHPLVDVVSTESQRAEVREYVEQARRKTELERQQQGRQKSGVFSGAFAINPHNGETVPIWIADYVLGSYGTGAIMAVPAYDERDREFAEAFGLSIRDVPLLSEQEAARIGQRWVQYRLRDWLISRQRYWGTPIPIVYCDACGVQPVPESELPVQLPDVDDWMPRGTGRSPLADVESFVQTRCPACGRPARRETDVCDNFLDSAWYFLRYPSTERDDVAFDPALTRKWLPVDMYIGGAEHSVLHLLYSRFVTLALHDLGHLHFGEPFTRFRAHGLLLKDGAKMSKSRGNVVNPDAYFARLGADTLRMYLMFVGPYDRGGDWSDKGIGGIRRFLGRVWDLCLRHAGHLEAGDAPVARRRVLHTTIRQVTADVEQLRYNTAIAALMAYSNTLHAVETLCAEELHALLLMLAPFAPHLAEELWQRLGMAYSIHSQRFPEASTAVLQAETVRLVVQVNGRARGVLDLPSQATEEEALAAALELESARRALPSAAGPPRVVYVPRKVINLVTL
jgi:leucyl-tRNA synthetase